MTDVQLEHGDYSPEETRHSICILANDIEMPANIGSLFRLADAFGVETMYLTGTTVCPPNSKLKKTSRSSEKYVVYEHFYNPHEVIELLKSNGFTILSLEMTQRSISMRDYSLKIGEKICLIVGNEKYGVNETLLAHSDHAIHIPMYGKNSSMNLASACAIALYDLSGKLASRK